MKFQQVALLFLTFTVCVFSQSTRQMEIEKRVAALNRQLLQENLAPPRVDGAQLAHCKVNCASATQRFLEESEREARRNLASMDQLIEQIHGQVDAYVAETVKPGELDLAAVEQGLRQLLGSLCDTPPVAFVADTATGRSLIAVYALNKGMLMGPWGTSVSVRAYQVRNGALTLADTTGADLHGYANLAARQLPSPDAAGPRLLVWGQMTGANGPNIRMRVYAYDGAKFTTVWMPENAWGAFTVRVTDQGFAVDGDYYRTGRARHDRYQVAEDGLYRVEDLP